MYSAPALILRYLIFYREASNAKGHGMHSPFVYRFIKEVLQDPVSYPAYTQWKSWRKELLRDKSLLPMQEMGAGSAAGTQAHRRVCDLVRTTAKSPRIAKLLYRIAQYYQPDIVMELGTSTGLSTALFSLARPLAVVHTLEGMPSLAQKAQLQFSDWGLENVVVHKGNFDDQLLPLLARAGRPGMVFIDGNHRKEPTLRYFNWLAEKMGAEGILIFDDIHWSAEMEEAWAQIKADPRVTCTIDLFQLGIVFFRSEFLVSRHFKVRY